MGSSGARCTSASSQRSLGSLDQEFREYAEITGQYADGYRVFVALRPPKGNEFSLPSDIATHGVGKGSAPGSFYPNMTQMVYGRPMKAHRGHPRYRCSSEEGRSSAWVREVIKSNCVQTCCKILLTRTLSSVVIWHHLTLAPSGLVYSFPTGSLSYWQLFDCKSSHIKSSTCLSWGETGDQSRL